MGILSSKFDRMMSEGPRKRGAGEWAGLTGPD